MCEFTKRMILKPLKKWHCKEEAPLKYYQGTTGRVYSITQYVVNIIINRQVWARFLPRE
jgi:ribosomal protein L21E